MTSNTHALSNNQTTITLGEFERSILTGPRRVEYFDTNEFRKALQGQFRATLGSSTPSLLSADVFDTLLLREPTSELTRFTRIAERQAATLNGGREDLDVARDLLVARLQATRASYRSSVPVRGCREGSIDEIYRVLAACAGLDAQTVSDLIETELEYECEVLEPNWALVDVFDSINESGALQILISDMYMGAAHISYLLTTFGLADRFDHLYSSADSKVSKSSGKLFADIISELDVTADASVHIGDNLKGDYARPKELGIRALYLPVPIVEREMIRTDFYETANTLSSAGIDIERWMVP